MSKTKLKIENLFKIFGPKGKSFIDPVKNGMSKQELLDEHSHVLGLNNINLDIPEQRIQVIMGLSGSGKSTLIRHINRLIEPTAGAITVDDEDILSMSQLQLREFRRKKTSMVFQKFALLPHKTVAQNVAYGLTIQGEQESIAKERLALFQKEAEKIKLEYKKSLFKKSSSVLFENQIQIVTTLSNKHYKFFSL